MKDNYTNKIDIEHIRKAIQLEEKYKYIDVVGREKSFSGYMISQLKLIYKYSGKNSK